jgi:ketosteroid isomerase-like protein
MTEPSRSVDRETAEAMLRAMHEHAGGSPTGEIADFIHPDAEMRLLVSFNRLLRGRDAVVEALEHGRPAAIFRAHVERFEWLDEQTSLAFARARYALEQGGYAEGRIVWLDEIRDGKIWRVRNFTHEAEARRAYEVGEDGEAPDA